MAASYFPKPLEGSQRTFANVALAMANFIVVLDMSIANVSIPHISGSLAISPSQGTWIITSYAVADAITVPLTGWLVQRFGAVRIFTTCLLGFGLFSVLCGLSVTLDMLVLCRVGQGLCGGPLIPVSQLLMQHVNPPEKRGQAMGIWAMTTMFGPALGPILGGTISDNWSWHWIFFINIPAVMLSVFGVMTFLRGRETLTQKIPIDRIGLALMLVWIGALQIMLDIGREHDWFADTTVIMLALVAGIGFVAFVIWELAEEHPIVDLRVFRHRGFAICILAMATGFGAYFAGIVVIPQWLQISLGYSATRSGIAIAFTAMGGVITSLFASKLLATGVDRRLIISAGLCWVAMATMLRTGWTSEMDYWTLIFPQIMMGGGMTFFFIAVTMMCLASVPPHETASAVGIQAFIRTISMAIATSISVTYWGNQSRTSGSILSGEIQPDSTVNALASNGFTMEQARMLIAQLVERESLTLATNRVAFVASLLMIVMSALIWLAPRQRGGATMSAGH